MKTFAFKPFGTNTINICVMDNNLEHNDWMDEAPHLSRLPKVNPFAVPDQYFEGLSDRISAAVFVDDLKLKAGLLEEEVPEGYFENLSAEINSRILLESLNLKKQDGYAVPGGYFEKLHANILNKVTEEPAPAKIKIKKLWLGSFAKYAVAASLVLVSAFAVYFNQDRLFGVQNQVTTTAAVTEDSSLWDIEEEVIIEQIESGSSGQVTSTSATSAELEDYILSHYTQNEIASNL